MCSKPQNYPPSALRAYTLLIPLINEKPAEAIIFLSVNTNTLPSASFMSTSDSNCLLSLPVKLTSSFTGC